MGLTGFDAHKIGCSKRYKKSHSILAAKIKLARKDPAHGWTQMQLALLLGVNQSQIFRIENYGVVDFVLLRELALVCNKQFAWFIAPNNEKAEAQPALRPWVYLDRDRSWWKYTLAHNGRAGTNAEIKAFNDPKLTPLEEKKAMLDKLRKEIRLMKAKEVTARQVTNATRT